MKHSSQDRAKSNSWPILVNTAFIMAIDNIKQHYVINLDGNAYVPLPFMVLRCAPQKLGHFKSVSPFLLLLCTFL